MFLLIFIFCLFMSFKKGYLIIFIYVCICVHACAHTYVSQKRMSVSLALELLAVVNSLTWYWETNTCPLRTTEPPPSPLL